MKPNSTEKSSCCNAQLKLHSADEGTNYYTCVACGNPTDPAYPNQSKEKCEAYPEHMTGYAVSTPTIVNEASLALEIIKLVRSTPANSEAESEMIDKLNEMLKGLLT
jgi:hypothetical protein